ncbi:hypothetical protein [Dactylosporangium sp. NPDC050588]|uniref:hypothetical protein n=1 Tax=Dactylosporangium sp. NPDC050588 TaxID=3157211 RepID=UPI003405CD5B
MTYDLYFWPAGAAKNARRLADRLAEGRPGRLKPDPRVLRFRAELLRRWPELASRIEPWHTDVDAPRWSGPTDEAHRYVVLTLAFGWPATDALPTLAGAYGLDCYDPQCDALIPAPPDGPAPDAVDDVGCVAGSADEDHLARLLHEISLLIGYRYDDLDAAALHTALDGFEYPLAGSPPLLVRLAQPPGSPTVAVRVEGAMDLVLGARLTSLLELAEHHPNHLRRP